MARRPRPKPPPLNKRDAAIAAKRRKVARLLLDHEHLSDREIARLADGVAHSFVGKMREEYADDPSAPRLGADGKTRRRPRPRKPDPVARLLSHLRTEIRGVASKVPRMRRGELLRLLQKETARLSEQVAGARPARPSPVAPGGRRGSERSSPG